MQQNMTEAQKLFVRLNPTVGYEEDLGLGDEIDLAIDFQLVCEVPIVRIDAREENCEGLSDPTWFERFNAEAEASFEMSFTELDAAPVRRRVLKRGAA